MNRVMAYLSARIRSFGYAFRGIAIFFRETPHAKVHLLAIGVITALGWYVSLATWEWCGIFLCMGLVVTAEAINSAIEYVVDLVSPNPHPLAGKAKDVAAGAVLLSVIFCGIVWALIFLPKLLLLLT
jgi:diacylglycerol kinase